MAGFTKEIIIQTLLELLNEKPLAKITVKDIVERCGVNRNTFYYHFRDIPDVMYFALKREADRVMSSQMEIGSFMEGLVLLAERLGENKKAILHIYRSADKEIMAKYLRDLAEYIITQYAGKDSDLAQIPEKDKKLLIHYEKCVIVGMLLDWMDQGMKYDLVEYARRLNAILKEHGMW